MQGDTKTDLLIGVGTTMIALELDAKYRWQIPAEMTIHNILPSLLRLFNIQ